MVEDLTNSIVDEHPSMGIPRLKQMVVLSQLREGRFFTETSFELEGSGCVGLGSFKTFCDAFDFALNLGYIPLKNDHPATQMLCRLQLENGRTFLGLFVKK